GLARALHKESVMTFVSNERETLNVKIADLSTHPRQAEVFGDLPEEKLLELAADLERNGQKTPIEVTPENVIICGHQRVRAAELLAWTEINAVVRDDLADEGDASVFEQLVKDNLNRRHLDQLSQARCYQALKANALKLPRARRKADDSVDIRDLLAVQFNMSGRNLERLVKILSAPIEVQHAVSASKLTLKAAGEVARATKDVQEKIAAAISEGNDPESVVAAYL